ncbi:hypothetical protein ACHAXT_009627 [Thalassiosira profunda]
MLQQLTVEQASNCPFPVGSSVWYEAEQENQQHLAAGTVQSISLDFESRRFHYEVNGDAIDEQRVRCFGDRCPIYIKVDEREVEGIVLYCSKKEDKKASYAVKVCEGDNQFSIEEGIPADRIRFRAIDTQPCEPGVPETVSLKAGNTNAEEEAAKSSSEEDEASKHETLQEEKDAPSLRDKLQSELGRRTNLRQERKDAQSTASTGNPSSNEADDEATANTESAAEKTTIRVSSDGSELESILTDDRSILSVSTREKDSSVMLVGNKRGRSEKGSEGNPKPKKSDKVRFDIPNWLTSQDGNRQQRLFKHLTQSFQGLPVDIKGRGEEMYVTSTAKESADLAQITETLHKSLGTFIGDEGPREWGPAEILSQPTIGGLGSNGNGSAPTGLAIMYDQRNNSSDATGVTLDQLRAAYKSDPILRGHRDGYWLDNLLRVHALMIERGVHWYRNEGTGLRGWLNRQRREYNDLRPAQKQLINYLDRMVMYDPMKGM